jgi:NADPH:quinone reductase-like Zn-dependent oxidoreductase
MPYRRVITTRFGGPEVLQLVTEPDLPEPGPGQARVKVQAATASYTDTIIRNGRYPDVKNTPPFTPGYDLVGVVDALGPSVTGLAVGQRVAALTVIGAYCEYLCVRSDWLVPVPDGLDAAEAVCLVLTYTTAYQMLHRVAKVEAGQRILVIGAGGAVGTAILQLAQPLGLRMYGTASSRKRDWVAGWGATPIDYQSEDVAGRVRELTGDGVDVAFDPLGGASARRSVRAVRRGGLLVAYGFHDLVRGRENRFGFYADFIRVMVGRYLPARRRMVIYTITGLRREHPDWFREDLTALFELLGAGQIKPVIAARLPLAEAAQAHRLLDAESVQGKLVLDMSI